MIEISGLKDKDKKLIEERRMIFKTKITLIVMLNFFSIIGMMLIANIYQNYRAALAYGKWAFIVGANTVEYWISLLDLEETEASPYL